MFLFIFYTNKQYCIILYNLHGNRFYSKNSIEIFIQLEYYIYIYYIQQKKFLNKIKRIF